MTKTTLLSSRPTPLSSRRSLSSRRLCHPDEGGICDPRATISSNESIFIDSYLLGSLLRQPLRCFVPQHDKNDAFVIPTFFVIPTLLSSRRRRDLRAMQKQFQATNLYSLIYFIRIAFAPVIRIALRQPLRCFVPQHDKTDAFVITTLFVIPTKEGSAVEL